MTAECTHDGSRLRAYLNGWRDAEACIWRSFVSVPEEHWAFIVRHYIDQLERAAAVHAEGEQP